ncbi:helix-turn-helix domain-containing protein [Streptomyces sp. NPDC057579]|uniref:helix-turn-helix domain-containing protein n=1 Tax=Streptomyces sp. NPDC057579 TaxID=3346172 RepID=UPI00368D0166
MYALETRKRALTLVSQGRSLNSVSREMGISRHAISTWLIRIAPIPRSPACVRCAPTPEPPPDGAAYAYVLGLYLGDGHVMSKPRQHHLTITCADAWPGLIDEAEAGISRVMPSAAISRRQKQGCTDVKSFSIHWACLLPQHGPGKKHDRDIRLEAWQRAIVDTYPWEFIRGLVHSDGCRITNWTTRVVAGERKRYEYPRYFFTNKSADIRRLYAETLDKVGVEWRAVRRGSETLNISVARRASVALMDKHIGPKY